MLVPARPNNQFSRVEAITGAVDLQVLFSTSRTIAADASSVIDENLHALQHMRLARQDGSVA
jgi:hypothetical protein